MRWWGDGIDETLKFFLLKDNDYGYLKNSQYSIDVLGLGSASQKS